MIRRIALFFAACAGVTLQAGAVDANGNVLVLTSLPVTYSIASALTTGTHVTVQNVPETGRRMNAQANYFSQQAPKLAEQFGRADAVVTMTKLWQDDPFFTAVRGGNIRVVDIEATKPFSDSLEGISIVQSAVDDAPWSDHADEPTGRSPSVYFWLSPSNGARTADIIAQDLMRLAPADAKKIDANLAAYRRQLGDLRREYEAKFSALPDLTVYALAPELVYLTTDLSIFVDGYFLKQDIHWTDQDAKALTAHLKEHGIKVVVHQWDPSDSIKAAIAAAGAKLVVLDLGDGGIVENGKLATDGYVRLLRSNLDALYGALKSAN